MKALKITALMVMGLSVSGCAEALIGTLEGGNRSGEERWVDAGRDEKSLTQLVAGIWVDPNGCDHWIIDDGIEGYLSERLTPDGRPVCSGVAPPSTAVGPFMEGTNIADPL
ncbi:MAG: hypothetical protein ACSHWY_10230 [Octadecabacter sp.]